MGQLERVKELMSLAEDEAGSQLDRDFHVFVVLEAAIKQVLKEKINLDRLSSSADSLANMEIFYEMLGRSILAEQLLHRGKVTEAREQADRVLASADDFVPRAAVHRARRVDSKLN